METEGCHEQLDYVQTNYVLLWAIVTLQEVG